MYYFVFMTIQILLKRLNETMTELQIAKAIKTTQPNIHRWKTGKVLNVPHQRGEAIIQLAKIKGIDMQDGIIPQNQEGNDNDVVRS